MPGQGVCNAARLVGKFALSLEIAGNVAVESTHSCRSVQKRIGSPRCLSRIARS